ncbi:MAG TPA: glycosyltransferase, partial [Candidatus Eisenbacteria bacterium]|nr:glycosyltransferase [Candidatus Eisenbacteria bacterium]
VRAEAARFRPDVTVAHFLPNYGFLAALAGLRPWMLVAWGSDLLVNARRSPFHRARARWTLRRADLVHVDAALLAEAAIALGAPPERVWTRAWGVDVDALAPADPWSVRRARAPELRVLWTRQLEPLYDPETFVRALGRLRAMEIPFRATLAGSGPLRSGLERLARREKVAERIRFAGWVDRERLTALYRSHDVYVSLSRSDSTSQSLLEALAAGLVPVVTDIAGNLEWVRHRREGLLVPPGDPDAVAAALEEIARGGEHLDAIASRAAALALERARFSDTVRETEDRLRALARGSSAHGDGMASAAGGAVGSAR